MLVQLKRPFAKSWQILLDFKKSATSRSFCRSKKMLQMSISLQKSVQQLWPVFATASISYRAGETLKVRPNRRSRQALQRPVDVFNEVAKLLLRLSERHVGFDAWKTLNVSTRILGCDSCGFPHCKRASKQARTFGLLQRRKREPRRVRRRKIHLACFN